MKWSVYSTGHFTNFGSHSTQLVESLNRLLKMWDVNDKASLSQAVERICTVKGEEETRRQITAMKDRSALALAAGSASTIQQHDAYKTKVRKLLTGAAAGLCEEQYDLFSQYHVTLRHTSSLELFSFATQIYIVKHKITESSEYQVHISPTLIYCPCGYIFTYLLPCRHVLAANNLLFSDIFQAGQYHPRWWFEYSSAMELRLLSKQFWISIGKEVTKEGVCQVKMHHKTIQQEVQEGKQEEEEERKQSDASAAAAAHASTPAADYSLPSPMYPSSMQELHPSLMTPQHLYHLIEGECASLRQLACTNPARLSGMVWMELHQAKMRITQHIDREQRMQQQQAVTAAAAVVGELTSEGFPLSSLLAPVPLTANKPGRPTSKRARAATEGKAARKVRVMLPAAYLCTQQAEEQEDRTSEDAAEVEEEGDAAADSVASSATTVCTSACTVAAAAACATASAPPAPPAAAPPAAAAAAAAAAVRSSVSGRLIVPPASFDC